MKSVIPAAKIVRYSREPCCTSPKLTCTIYAVMVSTGTVGSNVRRGCCPAAIATIMVSPIALDIARIIDTTIPEEAAGTKTLNEF